MAKNSTIQSTKITIRVGRELNHSRVRTSDRSEKRHARLGDSNKKLPIIRVITCGIEALFYPR
jgi:hypothetical protein